MTIIYGDGGTTIYIRQDENNIIYFSNDITSLGREIEDWPCIITNTTTQNGQLNIIFRTDITITSSLQYFRCGTDNIQFGSTSLDDEGKRPIITINLSNNDYYDGLIENGKNTNNGYNNIYIYNLVVDGTGGSLQVGAGWIGKKYFGNGVNENYIINCSSYGDLNDSAGGIIGSYAGANNGTLIIYNCSSYGSLTQLSGGIVGAYAGNNGGNVQCKQCWNTGIIGDSANQ
jgi:hypothetical protein